MKSVSDYKTEQERFWAGDFGDEYIDRNTGPKIVASKTALFGKMLSRTNGIRSVLELGANIGLNMLALKNLIPDVGLEAVEINRRAFSNLSEIPGVTAHNTSILGYRQATPVDLSFTCGVLIHIDPSEVHSVYKTLYESTTRYICIIEYYNPYPIEIPYRGHDGKLFKRDWAGEMMKLYPGLALVDYGFVYHGDPIFPGDDLNWFLLEKRVP
jgi:spore coat polysaccharide biosynthesis protein SpsF